MMTIRKQKKLGNLKKLIRKMLALSRKKRLPRLKMMNKLENNPMQVNVPIYKVIILKLFNLMRINKTIIVKMEQIKWRETVMEEAEVEAEGEEGGEAGVEVEEATNRIMIMIWIILGDLEIIEIMKTIITKMEENTRIIIKVEEINMGIINIIVIMIFRKKRLFKVIIIMIEIIKKAILIKMI